MPIRATCRECGKSYNVRDELAGKKFRCKQCQKPVSVPQPAVLEEEEAEEDLWDSDFGSFDDQEDDYLPPPPPKKKKKRRSSGGAGGIAKMALKTFVGAISFLFMFGLGVKLVSSLGNLPIPAFATSWEEYTTPDGALTMQMPGTPKRITAGPTVAAGGATYGVQKSSYACAVIVEPLPPQIQGMDLNQIINALETGLRMQGASNLERMTFQGKSAVAYTMEKRGITARHIGFVNGPTAYTLMYSNRGSTPGAEKDKFFNSVRLN
ncbi:hypothetical protein KOR42_43160 [Thalassoglobus neptunius]|uniref:Uncharacterized protein n=1 Tax=Thalassoglobus neptunius TaxID=1938619 RepID=A0A5C5WBG2_9PLAN|nr:hypothetical protein [Thalassoglobus neptunius]TWT46972.1 hypothetical protein KOR42_43160 [Thalassoglobus neptunius]